MRRHDIQNNGTKHKDRRSDRSKDDIWQKTKNVMLSVIDTSVVMLSVITPSVVMLSDIIVTVITVSIIMLNVIMLDGITSIIMLCHYAECFCCVIIRPNVFTPSANT
jgi:hypothetical protein